MELVVQIATWLPFVLPESRVGIHLILYGTYSRCWQACAIMVHTGSPTVPLDKVRAYYNNYDKGGETKPYVLFSLAFLYSFTLFNHNL